MDTMAISEKELKFMMSFLREDLEEAEKEKDIERKNERIKLILEKIQKYMED